MPALFRLRSKPTATTNRTVVDCNTVIDYNAIYSWLTDVEADMQKLRAATHQPYQSLLTEARRYFFSNPSEHLQKLLDNEQTMDEILRMLRRAGNPTRNPTSSKLLLMEWQTRHIWVKCRIKKIWGEPSSGTVSSLVKDFDFNVRIDAVVHYWQRHMTRVLIEINDTLLNVGREIVYTVEGPEPDISNVDTHVNAAEFAKHQDGVQTDTLTQDPDRDHRISCALCLEHYNDADDSAFELVCGHTVGQTCMATWLTSSNTQSTSCPYCKHALCPPRAYKEIEVMSLTS
ncbi:hypothetical protein E8E12_011385 [Didymella heteroderae]|uniref:RING-type domain-containing protein n=1 Tax=Didymella heteroderae TaxID=1769908 RepID=A0A9P5C560_9PLEO|nr:hypothetical protein E8E12_011385 [Didymella heteroderae]